MAQFNWPPVAVDASAIATETTLEAARVLLASIDGKDFATQTTLAALNGKDFATETKLEAVRVLLASLEGKDFATAAGQTAIIGYVDGIEALLTSLEGKDFATQTTLAALNGKDFATETKLEAVRVLLASLDGKDFATQTTLAALNGKDFATETKLEAVRALLAGTLTVAQAAPVAKTVKTAQVTVGTTAVRATTDGAAVTAGRVRLTLRPSSANTGTIYIGSSGVTTANGLLLFPGESMDFMNDAGDYYVISDTAGQTVMILEQE